MWTFGYINSKRLDLTSRFLISVWAQITLGECINQSSSLYLQTTMTSIDMAECLVFITDIPNQGRYN